MNPALLPFSLARRLTLLSVAAALAGCAHQKLDKPIDVSMANVETLEHTPTEFRYRVALRIQNPNQKDASYSGASVALMLAGKRIGTGVASAGGTVPRLGETIVKINVTVSDLAAVRQAIGMYGAPDRRIDCVINGQVLRDWGDPLPFRSNVEMQFIPPVAR